MRVDDCVRCVLVNTAGDMPGALAVDCKRCVLPVPAHNRPALALAHIAPSCMARITAEAVRRIRVGFAGYFVAGLRLRGE